jgi:hypothetical protein
MPGKVLAVPASARALALVEQARGMLAEARDLTEVREVIGKAEAIRHYLKQQGEALEAQNIAAEIKLRAERRAGELLKEAPRAEKGRPPEKRNDPLHFAPPTLEDLGIGRMQSSRYQAIASVPEPVFEEHIEEAKAKGKPITTNGALRLAKALAAPSEPPPAPVWRVDEAVEELIDTLRRVFDRWPESKRHILGIKLRDIGNEILRTGDMPE